MTVPAVKTTRCRSCNALIVFVKTTTGKLAPFAPDPDGEWIIGVDGVASHQGKAPAFSPPERIVPRYTSHFASCPQAGHWRGKR